ncbi:ATP binding [Branchiostoma belcheri]|nr:ATP binding [Branchiostoma belcheri]
MDDSYFANNHIQYFPRPAYGHATSWAGQWNPERRSMSMNRSPPFSTPGRSPLGNVQPSNLILSFEDNLFTLNTECEQEQGKTPNLRQFTPNKRHSRFGIDIGGYAVCHKAWCLAYCVGKSRSYQIKKKYEAREEIVPDCRTGMVFHSRQYLMAKGWLESYVKRFGDAMQREFPVGHPGRGVTIRSSTDARLRGMVFDNRVRALVFSVEELRQNNVYGDPRRGYGVLDSNRIQAITEHLAGLEGTPTSPEDQAFKTRVNSCVNKKAKTTRYHKKHSYHP